MKLTKNQFQFIVNSDVEMLVLYLQSEQNMSLLEAFDRVYNSRVYEKLMDARTGLYLQSAEYIYDYLCEELPNLYEKEMVMSGNWLKTYFLSLKVNNAGEIESK